MKDRPRSLPARMMLFAAMFAAGVALYCGTYLLMLNGKLYWSAGADPATGQNLFSISPKYRIDSDLIARALMPAHWVDEFVRSDYWTTVEHSSGRKWKNPPLNFRR